MRRIIAFYLAGGEATFLLGDREVRKTSGSLVFVPRRGAHTVWNLGGASLRGIIVMSPGDHEHVVLPVENG